MRIRQAAIVLLAAWSVLALGRAYAQSDDDLNVITLTDRMKQMQPDYVGEHDTLVAAVAGFNAEAVQFNQACGSIDPNNQALLQSCSSQLKKLQAEKSSLVGQIGAFNHKVSAAMASPAYQHPAEVASESICGDGGCSDLKDAVGECSGPNCSQPINSKTLLAARIAAASIPSADCVFDGRKGCTTPVPLVEVVIDGNPLNVPQYAKDFVDAIPKEARNDKVNLEIKNYEYFASKRAEKQNQVLADKAAVAKNPADQNAKNLLNQHANELKIATGDETHAQERISMQIGLIGTPPASKTAEPPSPGKDNQTGKTQ
jgi:hypothetical protein